MVLPKLNNFSDWASHNAICVEIGDLTVWFSYRTPVAFQVSGQPRIVSTNYWSSATGVHLNAIDPDKSKRVKEDEFNERLGTIVKQINKALAETTYL